MLEAAQMSLTFTAASARIIIMIGNSAGATPTISLRAFADKALTDGSPVSITGFRILSASLASNTDAFVDNGLSTSGQFVPPGTDNIAYEVDVTNIRMPEGKPWLKLDMTAPGAATLVCAVAVCKSRFYGPTGNSVA
jgi:hypothetical protein